MPRVAATAAPLDGRAVDTVVVGAGITGACVSHALARRGSVLVLDRQGPGRGSTMASTALITFELDLPLHRLARMTGTDAAVEAWRKSLRAVQALRRLVHDEGIACGWADRMSLYLTGDDHGYRALRAESALRDAHDIPGSYLTGRELRDRFGVDRTGALHSSGAAVADPVRLTLGILKAAKGVEVRTPVEVLAARSTKGRVELQTSEGLLRAQRAVFCTGYHLLDPLPTTGLNVASTWAIATAAATQYPAWLDRTIVWEASDPYLYLRTMSGGRLIVGGLDEPGAERYADRRLLPAKAKQLSRDASRLLGIASPEIERCWSGAFGESVSGLPMIGAVPDMPGCYVVAGFGGNGITHAMLAAELLAADFGGRPLPGYELYQPGNQLTETDNVAN